MPAFAGMTNCGTVSKAKEEFFQAIQVDPDHGDTYISVGIVCLKEKNQKEAFPLLEKKVDLNFLSRREAVKNLEYAPSPYPLPPGERGNISE